MKKVRTLLEERKEDLDLCFEEMMNLSSRLSNLSNSVRVLELTLTKMAIEDIDAITAKIQAENEVQNPINTVFSGMRAQGLHQTYNEDFLEIFDQRIKNEAAHIKLAYYNKMKQKLMEVLDNPPTDEELVTLRF